MEPGTLWATWICQTNVREDKYRHNLHGHQQGFSEGVKYPYVEHMELPSCICNESRAAVTLCLLGSRLSL